MSGRPRKPMHLKLMQGTLRADRVNEREPKPRPVVPPRPAHLRGESRKFWDRHAPIFDRMGVLTEADAAVLEIGAELWADYQRALRESRKKGADWHWGPRVERKHDQLMAWFQRFGLTPADRSRVKTVADDDEDEEEFRARAR